MNRDDKMRKLLNGLPTLSQPDLFAQLEKYRKLTDDDKQRLLDEGKALERFSREISRYVGLQRYHDRLAHEQGQFAMNKRFGCQRVTNWYKWLARGVDDSLAPIDRVLGTETVQLELYIPDRR